MPAKDRSYTLTRHNIQQITMGENWHRTSAAAAKKKKMELAWSHTEKR